MGNDESDTSDMISSKISIHVPSWGTTTQLRGNVPRYEHFNPRSLVGNDRIWQNTLPSRWKFQSTFPRGERLYTDMQKLIMFNFNPRSLVGNDHGETSKLSQSADFNPRSLVGNDEVLI